MKKQLIIGVLATVFLLLITPIIPASQYNQVVSFQQQKAEEFQHEIIDQLEAMMNTIVDFDKLGSYDTEEENSLSTSVMNSVEQIRQKIANNNDVSENGFLFNFLISIILAIIGTIFGIIFGPILAIITLLITSPAILLAKIIEFIVNIFTP